MQEEYLVRFRDNSAVLVPAEDVKEAVLKGISWAIINDNAYDIDRVRTPEGYVFKNFTMGFSTYKNNEHVGTHYNTIKL